MRRLAVLLAGLCPALAAAQALPPDTLRALAGRMHAEGLLSDSLLADARARIDAGRFTLRSSLLASAEASALRRLGLPAKRGMFPGGMYAFGREQLVPLGAQRAAFRRSGALTPAEDRLLGEAYFAFEFPDSLRPQRDAILDTLRLPPALLAGILSESVAVAEVFHPGALAPWADMLVRAGAMTADARARLLADAVDEFDVLLKTFFTGYLRHALLVEPEAAEDSATARLAAAYERVAAWLRASGLADIRLEGPRVSVRVYPYETGGAARHTATYEAVVDGRTYRHVASSDYVETGEPADLTLDGRAFEFFNRVLRDRRSPHRLYVIGKARYEGDVPLVALTAAQVGAINEYRTPRRRARDAWAAAQAPSLPEDSLELARFDAEAKALVENELLLDPPFTVSGSADTLYTSAYLDTFWDRLGEVGVFDGWTPARRDSARRHLHDVYVTAPQDLVEALGPLVVGFGGEMSDVERPYETLLIRMANATRGAFRPEAVEDTYGAGEDSVRIAFSAGGRRFAARVERNGEYYSASGVRLIVNAARLAAPPAGFYPLLGSDEAFAFLTPAQHAVFEAYGLVEPGPKPWFDGD